VKRVVVGAHYGLRDWLAQRITAVVMAVYSVVIVAVLLGNEPLTYAVWREIFAQVWLLAEQAPGGLGRPLPLSVQTPARVTIPYLTEPWYC